MPADSDFDTRREDIRVAATKVFAARGFATTTMRDIAGAAGILAGSLYYYFESKDQLLVEGLTRYYEDAVRDLTAAAARDTEPVETLTGMLRVAVGYLVDRRDETTILHNDFDYLSRLPAFGFVLDGARDVERIWCGAFERGISLGALKPHMEPELAYRAVIGAVFSTSRWYEPQGAVGVEEFHRQLATCVLTGLTSPGGR